MAGVASIHAGRGSQQCLEIIVKLAIDMKIREKSFERITCVGDLGQRIESPRTVGHCSPIV